MLKIQLEPNSIHVWVAHLSQNLTPFKSFELILSLDEQEKADRYKFEKHRINFVIARAILRKLIGTYLSIPPEKLLFSYNDYGKPYLVNTIKSLNFNLSHSDDLVLYVFSPNFEVGIDVEKHHFIENIDDIAKQFFSAAEYSKLRTIPSERMLEAFFKCWTRKEAFIKAIGHGLSYPLDEFEVTLHPDEPAKILKIHGEAKNAINWSLHSFCPAPNFEAAFAFKGEARNIQYYQFNNIKHDIDDKSFV